MTVETGVAIFVVTNLAGIAVSYGVLKTKVDTISKNVDNLPSKTDVKLAASELRTELLQYVNAAISAQDRRKSGRREEDQD